MAITIAVTNLKGGVGKSSICQALGTYLADKGHKVCIVDTDIAQQTSMKWSGQRPDELPSVPVFTIANDKALTKNVLALKEDYEFVLIDGTPVLTTLTTRIILLSDLVLIPILPSGADVWSLENFIERYEEATQVKGDDIPAYVVLNKFNSTDKRKQKLDTEVLDVLKEMGLSTLKTKLNYRVAYRDAMIEGKTAYEFKDKQARKEVKKMGEEVLGIIKKIG